MGKKIKAVIIDDEKPARESLRLLLEKYCEHVELVGSANSAESGIDLIKEVQPHLVFLDVQMPLLSGFDMLNAIPEINFDVIFTTAYNNYAIKAIRFSAIDYLLKPVNINELRDAVNRINIDERKSRTNEKLKVFSNNLDSKDTATNKIVLPTAEGFHVVKLHNILYCKAERNYTWIHCEAMEPILTSKTLKEFEELLSDYSFFRVHQSYLINLQFVVQYNKGRGGQAVLSDGTMIDVSRSKKEAFVSLFKEG